MTTMKPVADHIELSEPAFLQLDHQLSVWNLMKKHRRALLVCTISFTSGILFGFDTIVNGAGVSMPAFIVYFGKVDAAGSLYLPSLWTSLWTSMSALAQALSAMATGALADRLGRKWCGVIGGVISFAGAAIQCTAQTRSILLAGKIVGGFGIGMTMAIGMTYASEVVPPRLVPLIQKCLVIFILFMQGLAMGVIRIFVPDTSEHAFRTVFAIQFGVAALVFIAYSLAPESPAFLVMRNRHESAKKTMSMLYSEECEREERYAYLVQTITEERERNSDDASYLECFSGSNLKRTLTMMFLFAAVNIGGGPFLSQSIYFLITVGLPTVHIFDISIGGFALAIIIIIATELLMINFPRDKVFLGGCFLNFITMLTVGCLFYAKGSGPIWAIAVLMNILISLEAAFMQAPGWSIAAEISSLRLRAKSMSLGIMAQTLSTWVFTFTVPYMYNVDSGDLGARTGFVFAGTSVLLLWGALTIVPNTTGLSPGDIDDMYEARVPIREFSKHRPGLDDSISV
ncbi:hypothetical protein N7456_004977 [Penicillium angulare]|uniref:Major facilitator superfamily (MFS) profile domain-containing protein n=1 Tax=Penicillium angulare TaxID=116970 RepID=A0A9W9KK48_9EURO|nr:hypothetical protein N7456_004977 [Penicillium angulare]